MSNSNRLNQGASFLATAIFILQSIFMLTQHRHVKINKLEFLENLKIIQSKYSILEFYERINFSILDDLINFLIFQSPVQVPQILIFLLIYSLHLATSFRLQNLLADLCKTHKAPQSLPHFLFILFLLHPLHILNLHAMEHLDLFLSLFFVVESALAFFRQKQLKSLIFYTIALLASPISLLTPIAFLAYNWAYKKRLSLVLWLQVLLALSFFVLLSILSKNYLAPVDFKAWRLLAFPFRYFFENFKTALLPSIESFFAMNAKALALFSPWSYLSIPFFALISYLMFLFANKKQTMLFFGLFALSSPFWGSINFLNSEQQFYSLKNFHAFALLPFLLAYFFISKWISNRALLIFSIALLASFSIVNFKNLHHLSNTEKLDLYLVKRDIKNPAPYRRLATKAFNNEEYEKSLQMASKALFINFKDFPMSKMLAQSLFHLNRIQEANSQYQDIFINFKLAELSKKSSTLPANDRKLISETLSEYSKTLELLGIKEKSLNMLKLSDKFWSDNKEKAEEKK